MGGIVGRDWRKGTPVNMYTLTHSPTEQGDALLNIYYEGVKGALSSAATGGISGVGTLGNIVSNAAQNVALSAAGNQIMKSNYKPTGTEIYGNNTAGIRGNMIQMNRTSGINRTYRK